MAMRRALTTEEKRTLRALHRLEMVADSNELRRDLFLYRARRDGREEVIRSPLLCSVKEER